MEIYRAELRHKVRPEKYVMMHDHKHTEKSCQHHYKGKFQPQNILVACVIVGVHYHIHKEHTNAEIEGIEKSRTAEIFGGGYFSETSERDRNGNRRSSRPCLAHIELSPVNDEMKYQNSNDQRSNRQKLDVNIKGIVALDRDTAYQKKRHQRCDKVVTDNEDKAKYRSEDEISVNEGHNIALASCDDKSRTDNAENYHKYFCNVIQKRKKKASRF